jgi:hypothetical protein
MATIRLHLLLKVLPEADFVSVRVFDGPEHTARFSLRWTRVRAFCSQRFQCLLDIAGLETETSISSAPKRVFVRRGNKFEQNAVDVEASNNISRDEPEP